MKLKQKLSLLAVGSVVLTSVAAVVFAHLLGKSLIENAWKTRFQDFAEAFSLPLSRAIAENDLVLLDAHAYDLKSRPSLYIHSLRIRGAAGDILVSLPVEEQLGQSYDRGPIGLAANTYSFVTPLAWSGRSVGEMEVTFVSTPVQVALAQMHRVLFLVALLGSILAILVSVRISNRLLAPMNRLVGNIGRLRRNEAAVLTPLPAKDEIAEMSNAFLEVYEEVRESERQNREMVSKLEAVTEKLSDELALNAKLRERLEEENRMLHEQAARPRLNAIIGEDGDLAPIIQQARNAARSKFSVLLSGESGTGKELIAHHIHQSSNRHAQDFVTVNCAALPDDLIESELFGHEKGAFTGAGEKTMGKFVLADGGTIFLDEIGELPLPMQPKLLRVLENGQVDRVGAREAVAVDVRVITATNRDLSQEVAAGWFREDLYYRLKVIHIHIPPLRERKRDIAALANAFIDQTALEMGIFPPLLSPAALKVLQNYSWPGNVRQLHHVLAATLSQHPIVVLEPGHLTPLLTEVRPRAAGQGNVVLEAAPPLTDALDGDFDSLVARQEKRVLEGFLRQFKSQKEVAERLKISEARLHRLLKKYELLGWKRERGH